MSISEEVKKFTQTNREAWEEAAPIHAAHNMEALLARFSQPDFNVLDETEMACWEKMQVRGKSVAHICCNNGQELLSVKSLGAGKCVGFDGAASFLDQARQLAEVAKLDADFICTDVYEIDDQFNETFDVVMITIGVLSWMPDLKNFMAVISRLLKSDGQLFIYEQHPILDMITPAEEDEPITWEVSYFDKEPYVEYDGLDYYGGQKYDAKPVTSFFHTMSEIIMSALQNDLALEHFEELPQHISNTWWNVEKSEIGLPMSYTAIFRK